MLKYENALRINYSNEPPSERKVGTAMKFACGKVNYPEEVSAPPDKARYGN